MKSKPNKFKISWGLCKFFGLVFLILALTPLSFVQARGPDSIRAIGAAALYYKKKHFHFREVLIIPSPATSATIMGYDDFGNNFLRMDFKLTNENSVHLKMGNSSLPLSEKRFQKLLAISISPKDLIDILLYRLPQHTHDLSVSYDSLGRMTAIDKVGVREKDSYHVNYARFVKQGKIDYPKSMMVSSLKTTLKISWQQIQLK